ncbi:MAG: flavodoxin domain-containing protein [Nitrososphaerota archaeon]|nr:flavodoxin domain-containing protein [Nitrososphaerota archaeon]
MIGASCGSEAKRAVVVFDTRYGNTEKIARSLEAGLKKSGIITSCVNAKEVSPSSLKEHDLIAVGAPTEWRSASKPMKAFLESLKSVDLFGKYGFAFDTKLTRPLSGSASNLIEKELRNLGINIIAQRESATVFLESGSTTGARLKQGEEKRFEEIGLRIGTEFLRAVIKKEAVPA